MCSLSLFFRVFYDVDVLLFFFVSLVSPSFDLVSFVVLVLFRVIFSFSLLLSFPSPFLSSVSPFCFSVSFFYLF